MGCCGAGQMRHPGIDNSQNVADLITVFKKLIENADEEIADMNNHVKKGSQLKTQNLRGFPVEDIQQRIPYLTDLNKCFKGIVSKLEKCDVVSSFYFILFLFLESSFS